MYCMKEYQDCQPIYLSRVEWENTLNPCRVNHGLEGNTASFSIQININIKRLCQIKDVDKMPSSYIFHAI